MNKLCCLIIMLITCGVCKAQNLVPNSSFENYGTLPCSWIISYPDFNNAMNDWIMPTSGSTDIFSTLVPISCYANCFSTHFSGIGYQAPRTGNVISALNVYGDGAGATAGNYREYLEIQLTSPLVAGVTYEAQMYVSLADNVNKASNNLGMYFSDFSVTDYTTGGVLNYLPQVNEINIITDTLNWVLISGFFTAASPAQYLIIGNFFDSAFTSIAVMGNSTIPILNNAKYFIDDISISIATGLNQNPTGIALNLYPNPVMDKLNIEINNSGIFEITVFDITSRIILHSNFSKSISLNTKQLSKGIYLYEVRNKNGVIKKGKIVKE